jgi:hypothetical protein
VNQRLKNKRAIHPQDITGPQYGMESDQIHKSGQHPQAIQSEYATIRSFISRDMPAILPRRKDGGKAGLAKPEVSGAL